MPFTQHDQRQPAIKQISFGDKAQIDNTRWLCLGDDADQQVIPASRDYVSQLVTQAKDRSSAAAQSGKMVIDQATALSSLYDTYNTMLSMYESSQKFAYDPFRGNTVAHGAIDGDPYLLIPCNKEFTTLRVISMTNEKLDLRQDATQWHSAPLPVGVIHTDLDIHVGPIQHITVSRAPDIPRQAMIVGVRAASRVLIIKITRSKNLTLSHELLYQLDAVRDNTFDTQWHPVDLCLSPYTFQHMAIMADDGQCMVVDLAVVQKADVLPSTFFYYGRMRDELLEEQGSAMPNSQRWKACVFGASPRSLVVASPKGLELVQFRDPQHPQSTLLYRCPLHTRLYTLASIGVRHSFQVVATSDESIILFDIRYPCQPVVAWDHLSPNPPPTCLQLVPDCKQPDHGKH
ncbi:hypothetical protein BC940DRAFT_126618 [Gongronella butleri]|nr:hypothetical protein BC940DRAFT_126618 [Gongronella butleri]